MKKIYTILRFYLCFLILLLGFSIGTSQTSQKNYSLLPAPAPPGQNVKPPSSIPILINGSMAYGDNIQDSDFYTFDIDDPTNWASVASVSFLSYSGDFAANDTEHMWIIDGNDSYLKKIFVADGSVVSSVHMPCPLSDGVWTVLSFHKPTGQLFAIATSNLVSDSRLYKVNLADGSTTELFQLGAIVIVSGTFDMDGNLFAFDLENDSIYDIDVYNQTIETLGYAGFDGNYIQGMGCDSETNEVYLAAFQASIAAELRLLDKNTGNTTFISTLPNETGGFGFPVTNTPQVYSVYDLYTNTSIEEGDTLWVGGYYTDTTYNLLLDFYGDWDIDEVFPAQSSILIEGEVPAEDSWNGGLIIIKGVIAFDDVADPYFPEDSVMATLEAS